MPPDLEGPASTLSIVAWRLAGDNRLRGGGHSKNPPIHVTARPSSRFGGCTLRGRRYGKGEKRPVGGVAAGSGGVKAGRARLSTADQGGALAERRISSTEGKLKAIGVAPVSWRVVAVKAEIGLAGSSTSVTDGRCWEALPPPSRDRAMPFSSFAPFAMRRSNSPRREVLPRRLPASLLSGAESSPGPPTSPSATLSV